MTAIPSYFRKSVLRVGTYKAPRGTLKVTPERLKHWRDTFKKTARRPDGVVAIGWDHADDPADTDPLTEDEFQARKKRKNSAEHTIGKLADIVLAPDGQSATLKLEVTDPKAADRAKRNEVFVSPVVREEWEDGDGELHEDLFTRVDFVNRPVDHSQGPFFPVEDPTAIACALRLSTEDDRYFPLSRKQSKMAKTAKTSDKAKNKSKGKGKIRIVSLSSEEQEEKQEKLKDLIGSIQKFLALSSDDEDDDEKDDDDAEDSSDDDEGMDEGNVNMEQILEALKEHDLVLPPDTDKDNLLERLLTALLTSAAHKGLDDEDDANSDDDDSEEDEDMPKRTVESPGYTAMSTEHKALFGIAQRNYRKQVQDDLDMLLRTGRITPAEKKAKEKNVNAIKLSFDGSGEPVKSSLEVWIDARKELPAGATWTPAQKKQNLKATKLSHVEETDAEFSFDGGMDESAQRELAQKIVAGKHHEVAGK